MAPLDDCSAVRYVRTAMAVRIELRPRILALGEAPRSAKRDESRLPWWMMLYWLAGLSLAYAIYADLVPLRAWIEASREQATASERRQLLAEAGLGAASIEAEGPVDGLAAAAAAVAVEPVAAAEPAAVAADAFAVSPSALARSAVLRDKRRSLGGGGSCEAAVAAYREKMSLGGSKAPADITAAQYGSVLNRGTYLGRCGVPANMSLRICAAVQNGRAIGVTVTSNPARARIERCVARAVRGLSFPSHPKLDVTTTVFK